MMYSACKLNKFLPYSAGIEKLKDILILALSYMTCLFLCSWKIIESLVTTFQCETMAWPIFTHVLVRGERILSGPLPLCAGKLS